MAGYETLILRLEFEGQEIPWTYPLALNGRKLQKVEIGGVEYLPNESEVKKLLSAFHCSMEEAWGEHMRFKTTDDEYREAREELLDEFEEKIRRVVRR